jgi:hypothetical protein
VSKPEREPTQPTQPRDPDAEPAEIPIPTREQFFRDLRKVAEPDDDSAMRVVRATSVRNIARSSSRWL